MDGRPGPNWTCPVCDQIIDFNGDSTESNEKKPLSNPFSGLANGESYLNSPIF